MPKRWDLKSGYCPHGHNLDTCWITVRHNNGKVYNRCTINHDKQMTRPRQRKVKTGSLEYRCERCNYPLMGGYHILGNKCK